MNYLKDKAEGLLTWFYVNFKWLPILCWRPKLKLRRHSQRLEIAVEQFLRRSK